MKNLPTWQKPIAWALVILAAPFVGAYVIWRAARRRAWAGRIYLRKEATHGRG